MPYVKASIHDEVVRQRDLMRELLEECIEFVDHFTDGSDDPDGGIKDANAILADIHEALAEATKTDAAENNP